ncbi:uncharacterized protein LOC106058262 [Biomphalaria glabrata]|uniref:Uncharacterized protein LOC106058262 n=1 Tax=Biomphalaria glabrata TaxID=6526 RepID=A0A9W2ZFP8_BIOGL|nr:uncharacterized protein LOC106058262 [Biomphalaria glabrata]
MCSMYLDLKKLLFLSMVNIGISAQADDQTNLGQHFLFSVPLTPIWTRKATASLFTLSNDTVDIEMEVLFVNVSVQRMKKGNFSVVRNQSTDIALPINRLGYQRGVRFYAEVIDLKGSDDFGVCLVYYETSLLSIATTLILPVETFAYEYILTPFKYAVFYIILTQEFTKIEGSLPTIDSPMLSTLNRDVIRSTSIMQQVEHLREINDDLNQGFINYDAIKIKPLKNIGLITGSHADLDNDMACYQQMALSTDATIETIPPKYTAGKSFIIFPITNGSKDNYITVVAMEVYTVITVHRPVKQDTYLASEGESTKIRNVSDGHRLVTSSKPVQCYYIMRSICGGEVGDSSLSLLAPTNLFLNRYIWSLPLEAEFQTNSFMKFIIRELEYNETLVLDGVPLNMSEFDLQRVYGDLRWMAGESSLNDSVSLHDIYHSSGKLFGLYLYGIHKYFSYMQVAGYKVISCIENLRDMMPDDKLDNDCDGNVDEEMLDNKDDDGDTLIDEDVVMPELEITTRAEMKTTIVTTTEIPETTESTTLITEEVTTETTEADMTTEKDNITVSAIIFDKWDVRNYLFFFILGIIILLLIITIILVCCCMCYSCKLCCRSSQSSKN